ncbi:unnamed protein product [Rhizoctonia solani]|uniref:Uncharacterized protein n=1 Tax=Rhizoctonia solani TaxID=456999 RepID=A0A8H3GV35_9AGAM|nr:unnamed protein product [Rhizoctonia solani]
MPYMWGPSDEAINTAKETNRGIGMKQTKLRILVLTRYIGGNSGSGAVEGRLSTKGIQIFTMDRVHDTSITSADNLYCAIRLKAWSVRGSYRKRPKIFVELSGFSLLTSYPNHHQLNLGFILKLKMRQRGRARRRIKVCWPPSASAQITYLMFTPGEIGEEHASMAENTDEPEGSSDDEADIEAQINLEIENLLREASETDSNPDIKKLDASEGQRAYNKKTRYTLYDSVAANISILVLTCWWLRIPIIYSDFVNLINTYQLPYLSVIPLLPDNMQKHLSTALRQELTPPHAPTVATLHVITRRIARRLHIVHGVDIPELNAAPILWRAVRAFQGPPMLYTMAKTLMERLKVPLTIHPALAPPPALGLKKYAGDWAPIEVTMSVVIIICLKLVYGFRDNINVVAEGDDPAACFPPFADYITSLRQGKEEHHRSFDRLLSLDSDRTADTLTEKEIDRPIRKYSLLLSEDILT